MAWVVLFDGDCAMCHGTSAWLAQRDHRRHLHFAPLTGITAQHIRSRHPWLKSIEALMVMPLDHPTERVLFGADALIILLRLTRRGGWSRCLRAIPRRLRDAGYHQIAAWRRRFPGSTCARLDLRQRLLP